MGGTIDKDFSKHSMCNLEMDISEPAARRILSKIRPFRSILVRMETVSREKGSECSQESCYALTQAILNSSHRRILVTQEVECITRTAAIVAEALKDSGKKDRAVVFTGSSTPERFRDSDADLNVGVALGFLQSKVSGVWISLGGLVLPWDRSYRQKDGHFVLRRKSGPIAV
ncbi:hypothetical protein Anas_06967 [Armadillidium nasatum]|uniref:L-asparaginase N-terminal domain-containing protein n=1 Tax=Armadillidium nasatum TaxID=96803 RepID=A0A5N5T548_9CRUS|nr:hypothetical protein Anas_06967 [Armadillidium nasatum]